MNEKYQQLGRCCVVTLSTLISGNVWYPARPETPPLTLIPLYNTNTYIFSAARVAFYVIRSPGKKMKQTKSTKTISVSPCPTPSRQKQNEKENSKNNRGLGTQI